MFSSYDSAGAYVAGEKHVRLQHRKYMPGSDRRLVVYCHGRGVVATEALDATYGQTARALAEEGYAVLSIDAAGATAWANSTSQSRLTSGIAWGRTGPLGASASKPPLLVGTSMGGMTALKYARTDPTAVAGVISLIGALDPDYIHDNNVSGLAAEMEAAYGSLAAYDAALPTTSAVQFAADLAGIPTLLVTSTSDTVTPNTAVTTVAAAAGSDTISLGPVGHTLTGLDTGPVVQWALSHAAP